MTVQDTNIGLKDVRINIKIEKDVRNKFDAYCKRQGTTMSDEIRRYIFKCILNSNNS